MKSTMFVPAALLCCAALWAGVPSAVSAHGDHSHDAKGTAATAAAAPDEAAMKAMMAEMEKLAKPGKEHDGLKAYEGKWKATVKSWMAPGEPTVSEGTMENKMQFGGRTLEGRYKGSFMGQPFEGVSLMGYDNMKKEYWSFWTDNLSTGNSLQTGPAGADPNTIVVKGMMPGMDGKPAEFTSTTKMVDANKHVMTMTTMAAGQSMTVMEITYTRDK